MEGVIGFFCSASTLYLLGSVGYLSYLFWEKEKLLHLSKFILVSAFFFHTLFLVGLVLKRGQLPTDSLFEATGFFAWAIAAATFLLGLRRRMGILGAFGLPLVFLLVLMASTLSKGPFLDGPFFRNSYFVLHILLSFLGYAAFAITFLTALMYLLLERQLKEKHAGRFFRRLPSLLLLERLHERSLVCGVVLLLLGLLFGFIWSEKLFGGLVGKDPKVLLAFATWLFYLFLLGVRTVGHRRGRKPMAASIALFGWVLVFFFGVRHSFFIR